MTDKNENVLEAEIAFYKQLKVKLETVSTVDDLADYVEELRHGYESGLLERQPLEEYLSGLSGGLYSVEGLCKNYGYDLPKKSDWKWFGRFLTVAFGHS